ncbi:MAG: hypothetical protein H0T70_02280, partial [Acidimicrobiia bacterium]|nr:hypothetical protein [Acidimicrobiia bacterium]
MTWCSDCGNDVGSGCEHMGTPAGVDDIVALPEGSPDDEFWEPIPGEPELAIGSQPIRSADSDLDLPLWEAARSVDVPEPPAASPEESPASPEESPAWPEQSAARPDEPALDLPSRPAADHGLDLPEPILDLPPRPLDGTEPAVGAAVPALDLSLPESEPATAEPALDLDLELPAAPPPRAAPLSLDLDPPDAAPRTADHAQD